MAHDHEDYCFSKNSFMSSESGENVDPEIDLFEDKNEDEILIDMVKQYPHLYDTSCKDYRDAMKKENSWEEIAKILQLTPVVCSNRWTRLRESSSKEKKKRTLELKSGSAANKRRGFLHFENMKFIDKFVKTRSLVTNVNIKRKAVDHKNIFNKSTDEDISNWIEDGIQAFETSKPLQPKNMNAMDIVVNQFAPTTVTGITERPPSRFQSLNGCDDVSVSSYQSLELNENDSLASTPTTSKLSNSPQISLDEECAKQFKKPLFATGKFNTKMHYKNTKVHCKNKKPTKEIENDEYEESVIKLKKTITEHLASKHDATASQNDSDVSFCNLIVAELKQMNQAEKEAKKLEILQILWKKDNK